MHSKADPHRGGQILVGHQHRVVRQLVRASCITLLVEIMLCGLHGRAVRVELSHQVALRRGLDDLFSVAIEGADDMTAEMINEVIAKIMSARGHRAPRFSPAGAILSSRSRAAELRMIVSEARARLIAT